jgi:hypothetical protein
MTNEQLAEIEARAAKAAEGPWGVWNGTDLFPIDDVKGEKQIADCDVGEMAEDVDYLKDQRANSEFIARSREDIPKLCAALRAARAENRSHLDVIIKLANKLDEADAENERLKSHAEHMKSLYRIFRDKYDWALRRIKQLKGGD